MLDAVSEAEDGHTSDHKSARRQRIDVITRGEVSVGRWPRFLAVGRGLARATLTSAREAGRRFGGWDGQRCG